MTSTKFQHIAADLPQEDSANSPWPEWLVDQAPESLLALHHLHSGDGLMAPWFCLSPGLSTSESILTDNWGLVTTPVTSADLWVPISKAHP